MTDMDAWIEEARAVEIGTVAAFLNLNLKGRGEMVGPCPQCGGTDRFAVNTKKGVWNCRGCQKGGDAIELAMHAIGCDFIAACEAIVGRSSPRGGGKRISEAERAEYAAKAAARNAERQEKDEADARRRAQSASAIWHATTQLRDTHAERYLRGRGLDPKFADGQLRAHHDLAHPDGGKFPALVARVSALDGTGCGVWRIFVKNGGGGKAPVENPKLGLGNTSGGAVRIGGVAAEIGIAEGIETALACRQMVFADTGRLIPVWAALSTSGMMAVELPPEIQSVRIYADADFEKLARGQGKPSPGFRAAKTLAERLKSEGRHVVTSIPSPGADWLEDMKATEAAA
jgi:hypothetical protein